MRSPLLSLEPSLFFSVVAAFAVIPAILLSGCGGDAASTTTSTITTTSAHASATTTMNPTSTTTAGPTTTTQPVATPCLCVFDIDRTLTGKQSQIEKCPHNKIMPGVTDLAYGSGTLTLSELAQDLLNATFCTACYTGVVSSGVMNGKTDGERKVLLEKLGGVTKTLSDVWSDGKKTVESPLVLHATDGLKQNSVRDIVTWFKTKKSVSIPDANVHFFDDRDENVKPFEGTGFNAHQISCTTRDTAHSSHGDADVGLCGGTTKEAVAASGVELCPPNPEENLLLFPQVVV